MSAWWSIDPIYITHSDIKKCVNMKFMPITICKEINKRIPFSVRCVQQYYGVWCVCMDCIQNRNKLLEKSKLIITGRTVKVFDNNPLERNYNINEKIVVRDLPYYVPDEDLRWLLVLLARVNLWILTIGIVVCGIHSSCPTALTLYHAGDMTSKNLILYEYMSHEYYIHINMSHCWVVWTHYIIYEGLLFCFSSRIYSPFTSILSVTRTICWNVNVQKMLQSWLQNWSRPQ